MTKASKPTNELVVRSEQMQKNVQIRNERGDDSRAMFNSLVEQLKPIAQAAAEAGFSEQDFMDAAKQAY